MKNLKIKLALVLLAMTVLLLSCNEDESVTLEESGVSFNITNLINSDLAAKDSDKVSDYPECSDALATEVHVTIDNIDYVIGMTSLGTNETEVLKLPAGSHSITSFAVMAGSTAIYVMPNASSDAATIYGLTGLPHTFVVGEFTKSKENVDVLCYNPASYALFGYSWYQYKVYEENEIFFFGDICTKFFEEWHTDPSTYVGQTTNEGYDFPAIFKVDIIKTNADATTEVVTASNEAWYGEGKPLGISFINDPALDEDFEFVISLLMPDNNYVEVHRADLPDGSLSIEGDASGFGGDDGVFDFAVGNCDSNQNIDSNLVLPAWLPVPKSGTVTLSEYNTSAEGYITATFSNLSGSQHPDVLKDGLSLPMWCADKYNTINANGVYNNVKFYSSLGDLTGINTKPVLTGNKLNKLNWIINNKETLSDAVIQAAIWKISDNYTVNISTEAVTFAALADSHGDFIPTVGDWAIILCDFGPSIQLMIVRVDP